jgi:hypothetical protein
VLFYGVVSDSTEEADGSRAPRDPGRVELVTSREEAVVQAWDRDEPEQAGTLRVEEIEFETSATSRPPPSRKPFRIFCFLVHQSRATYVQRPAPNESVTGIVPCPRTRTSRGTQ